MSYEPIKANIYIKPNDGEVRVTREPQLDRIEKKMDRILELLEGKELSISIVLNGKEVGEVIYSSVTRQQQLEQGLS